MMHNRKYCAEVAHNVSTLNRKAIERAQQLNVNVINKSAKLRSGEDRRWRARRLWGVCSCSALCPRMGIRLGKGLARCLSL